MKGWQADWTNSQTSELQQSRFNRKSHIAGRGALWGANNQLPKLEISHREVLSATTPRKRKVFSITFYVWKFLLAARVSYSSTWNSIADDTDQWEIWDRLSGMLRKLLCTPSTSDALRKLHFVHRFSEQSWTQNFQESGMRFLANFIM